MTAPWRLIRSCGPLLLAADAGRAVFVTSGRARAPKAYWGPYGVTKAGLEHLVLTWADEVRTSRLRINLFDPGVVATRMRAAAMPGEDPKSIAQPNQVAPAIADLCAATETRHGSLVHAA
jgi:NAD(P)-dependent dehydrogenase (short-subunit alcohol dehydrogenase family)